MKVTTLHYRTIFHFYFSSFILIYLFITLFSITYDTLKHYIRYCSFIIETTSTRWSRSQPLSTRFYTLSSTALFPLSFVTLISMRKGILVCMAKLNVHIPTLFALSRTASLYLQILYLVIF